MKRRGQISMEYIMLIGFLMLIFFVTASLIVIRLYELNRSHTIKLVEDFGRVVENEINMAFVSPPYYNRTIFLPPLLEGKPYTITFKRSALSPALFINLSIEGSVWSPSTTLTLPGAREVTVDMLFHPAMGEQSFEHISTSHESTQVRMETIHRSQPSGTDMLEVFFTEIA